jgi:hypothetical protein
MDELLERVKKLEFVDTSFSGGEVEYMMIENSIENVELLREIGIPEFEIWSSTDTDSATIDVAMYIFDFLSRYNITHYHTNQGFMTEKEYRLVTEDE